MASQSMGFDMLEYGFVNDDESSVEVTIRHKMRDAVLNQKSEGISDSQLRSHLISLGVAKDKETEGRKEKFKALEEQDFIHWPGI